MKTLKKKLIAFTALLVILIGGGCEKDEIEIADESIIVNDYPWINVYEMNPDYLKYFACQQLEDGRLNGIPGVTESDLVEDKNGNLIRKNHYLLKNGFIVGGGDIKYVYTDITFKEYMDYNKKTGLDVWPEELIKKRIIDTNPYKAFYTRSSLGKQSSEFTLNEIRNMIENGTIENYFKKLK